MHAGKVFHAAAEPASQHRSGATVMAMKRDQGCNLAFSETEQQTSIPLTRFRLAGRIWIILNFLVKSHGLCQTMP